MEQDYALTGAGPSCAGAVGSAGAARAEAGAGAVFSAGSSSRRRRRRLPECG